jgi:hypothetical protein
MTGAPLPSLVLYTRVGCALCDETRATLRALLVQRRSAGLAAPPLEERDIDTDPALELAFFDRIPVVELGARRVELALGAAKLRRLLADGLDRPGAVSRSVGG